MKRSCSMYIYLSTNAALSFHLESSCPLTIHNVTEHGNQFIRHRQYFSQGLDPQPHPIYPFKTWKCHVNSIFICPLSFMSEEEKTN